MTFFSLLENGLSTLLILNNAYTTIMDAYGLVRFKDIQNPGQKTLWPPYEKLNRNNHIIQNLLLLKFTLVLIDLLIQDKIYYIVKKTLINNNQISKAVIFCSSDVIFTWQSLYIKTKRCVLLSSHL